MFFILSLPLKNLRRHKNTHIHEGKGEASQRRVCESENGVRFRSVFEEGCGGRPSPHAGSPRVDRGEGASQWLEGRCCEMRGDLHLRWPRSAEDEVHAVPP